MTTDKLPDVVWIIPEKGSLWAYREEQGYISERAYVRKETLDAMTAERDKHKHFHEIYLDTLRAIRRMDDTDRIRLWISDTLSGCEPLESTVLQLSDERNALKEELATATELLRTTPSHSTELLCGSIPPGCGSPYCWPCRVAAFLAAQPETKP